MRARAVDAVSIVVLLETQIRRLVYAYTADERLALVIARLDVEPRLASRVRVSPARRCDTLQLAASSFADLVSRSVECSVSIIDDIAQLIVNDLVCAVVVIVDSVAQLLAVTQQLVKRVVAAALADLLCELIAHVERHALNESVLVASPAQVMLALVAREVMRPVPARCVDCSSSSAIVLLIDIVVDDGYLFHVFSPLRCSPRAPNNRCLA